jgi:hypothetical protein
MGRRRRRLKGCRRGEGEAVVGGLRAGGADGVSFLSFVDLSQCTIDLILWPYISA